MRYAAASAALALLLPTMSSCSTPQPRWQSTAVDIARAERAWADPWAAVDSPTIPTSGYGSQRVERAAGSRTTAYPGAAAKAALSLEVDAALAAGWSLLGVQCQDPDDPDVPQARAVLGRGTTVEDGARAYVLADGVEVTLDLEVAHHADGSWPAAGSSLDPAQTCLGGGASGAELPDRPGDNPLPGDAGREDMESFDGWEREEPGDAETVLRARLSTDPTFADLGLVSAEATLRTGDSRRFPDTAGGTVETSAGSRRGAVAEVVARMSTWDLTWVSCGPSGAAATLRLRTAEGTLTARLRAEAPEEPAEVNVVVRLPVVEAPRFESVDEIPVLTDSRCLDLAQEPSADAVVNEGTPVSLPAELHPIVAD